MGRPKKEDERRYQFFADSEVNDFGNSAYELLKAKMIEVPDYVKAQLDEAVGYLQRIRDCKRQIAVDGLMIPSRFGQVAHPLIKVQTDSMVQFHKLLQGLMLTPSAMDKARKADNTAENEALKTLLNPQ